MDSHERENAGEVGRTLLLAIAAAALLAAGLAAQQAGPSPSSTPTAKALLPASLDRVIRQVRLFVGGDVDRSFATLAEEASVPIGIEMLPNRPIFTNPDPRVVRRPAPPPPPLVLGPGLFSEELSALLDRQPGYELSIADGVIDIAPTSLAHMPGHFLDVPIDHFDVKEVPVRQAVRVLRHLMNPAFSDGPATGSVSSIIDSSPASAERRASEAERLLNRAVSLSIDRATPRQIMNRLVAQHGEVFWTVEYRGRTVSEAADAIETNCTIALNTFADSRMSVSFGPVRPPVPLSAAQGTPGPSPTAIRPPTQNGRVLVTLPTDAITLSSAVRTWARATHTLVGIETIRPALAPSSQSPSLYDLGGLPTSTVFDKLTASMPDYEWGKNGDVYHVRPKSVGANPSAALNYHVDSFNHDLTSPFDAVTEVQLLVNPRPMPSAPSARQPPTFAPFTDRPLAIRLSNVTVREILDAIVRAGDGGLLWAAEYEDGTGGARGLGLELDNLNGQGSVRLMR